MVTARAILLAFLGFGFVAACAEEEVPPGIALLEKYSFLEGTWVLRERLSFDYDDEGRWIAASEANFGPNGEKWGTFSHRLRYDGDRLIEDHSRYDQSSSPNPDAGTAVRYGYDDDGRLDRIELVVVTSTPGVERSVGYVSYDYDEQGRALRKVEDQGEGLSETEYFYDEEDRVREEQRSRDGELSTIVRYTVEEGLLTERVVLYVNDGYEFFDSRKGRVYGADGLAQTETSSVWSRRLDGESIWVLTESVEITRDPASRTVTIERLDLPDDLERFVLTFAPDGTTNHFDLPGWPRISDWDRSLVYPPRIER